MKKFFLLLFIFGIANGVKSFSQNLIPNSSFELYDTCPTTLDQMSRCQGWSSFSISPDYYNACNGTGGLGVPSNGVGYQAASSGVAYAGLVAYSVNGFAREIIGKIGRAH